MDLTAKKNNYVARLVAENATFLDSLNRLAALKAEWDADAYATGAQPASNNIADADLANYPHLTALIVNQLIGAHVAVKATADANRGYLEAARP